MEDRELKDRLEEILCEKLEKLDNLKEGSAEHSALVEDIQKLYKVWIEQYKVECEMFNQSTKIENEKIRDEKDIRIKEKQAENEAKRHRKIKWDTILTCATIVGLTIGCCVFEANGHIFPTKMLKYADKLKFVV